MISPPVMEALKDFNGYFTDEGMPSLPVDTQYGNLNLTYMDIVVRVDLVNESIVTLYNGFLNYKENLRRNFNASSPQDSYRHRFQTEQVVYWLRKIADEFISILYILHQKKTIGDYPQQIKIAGIGQLLKAKDKDSYQLNEYYNLLNMLNEISNAYKHTLINAQLHNHRGRDEPVVFALAGYNVADKYPNFHAVSLTVLLNNYNDFLGKVRDILLEDYPVR